MKSWIFKAVFKFLTAVFFKDTMNVAQILQGLSCKVYFILVPIFFPVGLFYVVVDIPAIIQAACYYAMRTPEIGL